MGGEMMKYDDQLVRQAAEAIDDLCLNCEKHVDSCYVAVAKRAVATMKKAEDKKPGEAKA
jgi:hypothetical protein